jgi:Flp pilus assembly protein TadD
LRNLQGARIAYRTAADIDSGNLAAQNNFAQVLFEQGCPQQALQHIEVTLEKADEASALRQALLRTRREIKNSLEETKGPGPSCPPPRQRRVE